VSVEPVPPPQPAVVSEEVREKIECHACGYVCFPQWMNGEARCLKCDVLLLTMRRSPRRVSVKQPAVSAMESESGRCTVSPNGMHHWKFGKCTHCQKGEGDHARNQRNVRRRSLSRSCKLSLSPRPLMPKLVNNAEDNHACDSVPVGGSLRAVRKLLSEEASLTDVASTAASDTEFDFDYVLSNADSAASEQEATSYVC